MPLRVPWLKDLTGNGEGNRSYWLNIALKSNAEIDGEGDEARNEKDY